MSTDSGIYQCVATNEFGSASAASLLLVDNMNKPNPPHHVHCNTVNSTAIFVSWKAPSGESAISYPPMLLKGLNESEENDDEDEHNHYRLVSSSNVTSPTTIYTVSYHTCKLKYSFHIVNKTSMHSVFFPFFCKAYEMYLFVNTV